MNPFLLLVLAAIASILVIPPVWRLAPRLGLLDLPDSRKVHRAPIPRVGGWGIALGTFLPTLLLARTDPLLQSFIAGGVVLFIFGVWDDAREIGHWTKFAGQIIATGLVVYWGDLYISSFPLLDGVVLDPRVGRPFTVFAMVGAINAINHSDGLDGLAAGESMLSLIALAILGQLAGSILVVCVALAAMGGILGFLRYNSHPARIFMGDSGSQTLGFTLAFLCVYLTQKADTDVTAVLPLLILGLPIADILVVLYRRMSGGMNWFRATRNHMHHRLLELGFKHYQTVVIIYSIQALLIVTGVLLRYESDALVLGVYLLIVSAPYGALLIAERRGWRFVEAADGRLARLPAAIKRFSRSGLLQKASLLLISIAVPSFMLLGSVWAERVPRDVALVAALLAVIVATQMGRARAAKSPVVRLAVYVAAIGSVYLAVNYPRAIQHPVQLAMLGVVAALVVAVSGYLRFGSDRSFGTTPTDYLIVFAVLALLIFADLDINARALVELVVYAVALLYGCEVLLGVTLRRWNALHLSTLAALTIMAVRGVL